MTNIRTYQNSTPELAQGVFIDDSAVVTGKVCLGEDASVWPCVSIRGDLMPITIGARTNIPDCAALHTTHASDFNPKGFPLVIGND